MLKMSFHNGTLDRQKAIEIIKESEKTCVYTSGYSWKNPTTYRESITKEQATDIIKNEDLLDITEEDEVFHLNAFSGNDMW